MLRYFLIFFLFVSTSISNAEIKEKVIQNLKNTKNLDFKFEQNINGKIENGNCTIQYPKKIFCEYARSNNKILVSNGKSLVIKTRTSYYRYPLKKILTLKNVSFANVICFTYNSVCFHHIDNSCSSVVPNLKFSL